jgi:argininosuccinate synthase
VARRAVEGMSKAASAKVAAPRAATSQRWLDGPLTRTVPAPRRIVLAYSGDLETAAAIPALADAHDAEIVTLTLDLGAGRDLEEIRDRALTAGAARAHVIDAREEFVRDFILPSLQAGALHDGRDPMPAALARPLVARKLAEVAAIEQARDVIDRCRTDRTLWGRQGDACVLTQPSEHAPDTPAYVEIVFERGVPAAVNGVPMAMTELIESLSIIAGHHGVGRIESASSCTEAPAALVLHAAHAALESVVLPADILRAKRERAAAYAAMIADGLWLSPGREAMDVQNAAVQAGVTGAVRITLFKGTLRTPEAAALDHSAVPRS